MSCLPKRGKSCQCSNLVKFSVDKQIQNCLLLAYTCIVSYINLKKQTIFLQYSTISNGITFQAS